MHVYQWKAPTNVMQQCVIWIVNSVHSFKTKAFIVSTAYTTCSSCCITDPLLSSSESLNKVSDRYFRCLRQLMGDSRRNGSLLWLATKALRGHRAATGRARDRYHFILSAAVRKTTALRVNSLSLSASLLSRSHHHEFGGHLFRGKQNFVSRQQRWLTAYKTAATTCRDNVHFVVHLIVSASDSLSTVYFIINSGFFSIFWQSQSFKILNR